MKTFEDCFFFVKNQLGIHLLTWQKEALRIAYENKPCYYIPPGRGCGRTVFEKAAKLLEEIQKGETTK